MAVNLGSGEWTQCSLTSSLSSNSNISKSEIYWEKKSEELSAINEQGNFFFPPSNTSVQVQVKGNLVSSSFPEELDKYLELNHPASPLKET